MKKCKFFVRDVDQKTHELIGYDVPNDFGLDLAVYRTRMGVRYKFIDTWRVSDKRSGVSACNGETIKEAIDNTFEHFTSIGIETVKEKLNQFMEENGAMPGYDDFRY